MTTQIIIDIETGARWFVDGRRQLRDILGSVRAEVESVLVMETGNAPITVKAARIVSTQTEISA